MTDGPATQTDAPPTTPRTTDDIHGWDLSDWEDVRTQLMTVAQTALDAHRSGDVDDVVGRIAGMRACLDTAMVALGRGPAAPAGWTLETAPVGALARIPAEPGSDGSPAVDLVRISPASDRIDPSWIEAGGTDDARWTLSDLERHGAVLVLPPTPPAPAAPDTTGPGDGSETDRAEQWRARAEALQAELDRAQAVSARRQSLLDTAQRRIAELLDAQAAPTPAEEPSLVDVDPDSPAGKVAAQLVEQLGEHLHSTGFALSRRTGELIVCPPPLDDPIGHLRAVAGLLPDGEVTANISSGWLHLRVRVIRDGLSARVATTVNPQNDTEQADARAWLAEIGVEVRS